MLRSCAIRSQQVADGKSTSGSSQASDSSGARAKCQHSQARIKLLSWSDSNNTASSNDNLLECGSSGTDHGHSMHNAPHDNLQNGTRSAGDKLLKACRLGANPNVEFKQSCGKGARRGRLANLEHGGCGGGSYKQSLVRNKSEDRQEGMPDTSSRSSAPAKTATIKLTESRKRSSASESSSSARGCEHLAAIGRSQEQHRQLQYQVHQQLQRIYGNKLQEIEQQRRQQHKQTTIRRLPVHGDANQTKAHLQQQQQKPAMNTRGQHHHLCLANGMAMDSIALVPRFMSNHPHVQPPKLLHHLQEQTYDSLNSMATSDTRQQQGCRESTDDFYDLQPSRIHNTPASNSRNIPGEKHRQQQHIMATSQMINHVNLLGNSFDELDGGGEDDDDEDGVVEEEEEEENDNDNDGADGQLDDEELLIPGRGNDDLSILNVQSKQQRSATASDRKRQLESLQYATATAAALLNVTANAAAAFASIGERQLDSKHQQQQARPMVNHRPTQKKPSAIYSETYQDINNNNRNSKNNVRRSKSEAYQVVATQRQPMLPPQQYRSPPVYATANDQHPQFPLKHRPPQAPISQAMQANHKDYPKQANMRPPANQKQQAVPIYSTQTSHHYQQQQVMSRLAPIANPRLVAKDNFRPSHPALVYYHHQRPPPAANQPHFILQQHQLVGQQNQVQPVYGHQLKPQASPPQQQQKVVLPQPKQRLAMLPANQQLPAPQLGLPGLALASGAVPALALLHHTGYNAAAKVGLIGIHSNGHQQQMNQPMYGAVGHFVSAITGKPNGISGPSHPQMLLDGCKTGVSCAEKISRIDLKIFWWCLLGVCVIITGAVLTIFRHLFQSN